MTLPSNETHNYHSETPSSEVVEQTGVKDMGGEAETSSTIKELGGPKGPEPTRFGDWERKGRCVDF